MDLLRLLPWRTRNRAGFASNVLVLFSWVVVAQAITMLVMPALTRLYRPDQFGVYSLFTSAAGMVAVVAALRYEYAIVLPAEERESRALVWLGFALAGGTSLTVWIVGSLAGGLVGPDSTLSEMRPWLAWLAAAVLLSAAYSILMYWALRRKAFRSLAISRVVIAIGMAGVQLGAALFIGPYTALLIAAMLIGQMAGVAYLMWQTGFPLAERASISELRAAASRYSTFPKYSALGSLLDGLSALMPVAMLTILFSPAIAGLYAVADKVVRTPSVLFGSSLQQVFYQRLAESRNDPVVCRGLLLRTWRYLVLIGAGPMVLVFLFGPQLFQFVFGRQWLEAGAFAQILTVGLMVHFVTYPTMNGILVFEKLGVMLAWQVFYAVSLALVFGVGGFLLRLPPRPLLWLFAGSQLVVHSASLLAQWKVLAGSVGMPAAPVLPGVTGEAPGERVPF